jgi:hypothetical protein
LPKRTQERLYKASERLGIPAEEIVQQAVERALQIWERSAPGNRPDRSGAPSAPAASGSDVAIVLYRWSDEERLADFDITAAEFARITQAVSHFNKDVAEDCGMDPMDLRCFFRRALVNKANLILRPGKPSLDLECAVNETIACIRLMEKELSDRMDHEGNITNFSAAAGICELGGSVCERLFKAWAAAHTYAGGRPS